MAAYSNWGWAPYVPVAERKRKAAREMDKLRKQGQPVDPVHIDGRTIAKTFWGKSWCANLERYSDYENRLPRGRTYVRNGSVVDLQIAPGLVEARVSGSSLYKVAIRVRPLAAGPWKAICKDCAGAIDSLVELLRGRLSSAVMERVCQPKTGLFPSPAEISLDCSCPDWADMCKHVAAVLYGVGARLDRQPELLFRLRGVDESELIAKAAGALPLAQAAPASERVLGGADLSALFGLDLTQDGAAPAKGAARSAGTKRAAAKAALQAPPVAPPAPAVQPGKAGRRAAAGAAQVATPPKPKRGVRKAAAVIQPVPLADQPRQVGGPLVRPAVSAEKAKAPPKPRKKVAPKPKKVSQKVRKAPVPAAKTRRGAKTANLPTDAEYEQMARKALERFARYARAVEEERSRKKK